MKKLLPQVIAVAVGLWIADYFIEGVVVKLYPESNLFGIAMTAQWQIFLFLGIILGLINIFVKPIIEAITLPLRMISLGAFSLVINMFLIWILDKMFKELSVLLWLPLLYTTLIIVLLNIVIQKIIFKESE